MRVFLVILALAAAALYFTLGLRVGYATMTPLYLVNAQGESKYPFRLFEAGKLEITGECVGQSGNATLRFLAPDGTELSAVRCPPGTWSLKMSSDGQPGIYTLAVQYQHYTGHLEVKSAY
ncbi:hypothetical protein [Deinococcus sp.]|uniref:hypothetical protein n=1 Tax=Deinococcus sp. TaxID=47478 RepID=UPI003B5C5885